MKLLAAILALACAAMIGQPTAAQEDAVAASPQREAGDSRMILVMLRLPAAHYRPSARYGGAYDSSAAQAARRRVAQQIARENGLELVEGWAMPVLGVDCYEMRVPEGQSIDAAIARTSRHRAVAWAQPVHLYQTMASSPDPLFLTQPAASEWRLAELHGLATGRGVIIAVVDSRIDVRHPDLAGQFVSNEDFVSNDAGPPENHGTEVAGVIGARGGNGVGIVGIAPGARMMALRACSERRAAGAGASGCNSLSLARALQFALERGARIINMSLSGPPDRLLSSLIEASRKKGVAVVAAFDPARPDGGFPASAPGVIAVADQSLPRGPEAVFRAPGRDIPTTQPGGRWYLVNGSSFAAAHVSGLLALLLEERRVIPGAQSIVRTRTGVVDACATLVSPSRTCDCECSLGEALARRGY